MTWFWIAYWILGVVGVNQSQVAPGLDAQLIQWLQKQPNSDRKADTNQLYEILQHSEIVCLDGGSRSCSRMLGAVLLDPAFSELEQSGLFDNVRYYLACAQHQQGGYGDARNLLIELIQKKPVSDFRAPAFRKLVDATLSSNQIDQTLQALAKIRIRLSEPEVAEIDYLQGKALMRLGHPSQALQKLAALPRFSRLFAQAAYLSGIIELKQGNSDKAEQHFCRLVHQPGHERYTYYISDKTAQVVAHAWLALARLRHDRGDYLYAIQTYRAVPQGTHAHLKARYESCWSSFRLGDFAGTRKALSQILDSHNELPERVQAQLLMGYSFLGECMFDQAEKYFDKIHQQLTSAASSFKSDWGNPPLLPSHLKSLDRTTHAEHQANALLRQLIEANQRAIALQDELVSITTGRGASNEHRVIRQLQQDLNLSKHLRQRLADVAAHAGAEQTQKRVKQLQAIQAQIANAAARATHALDQTALRSWLDATKDQQKQSIPTEYLKAESNNIKQIHTRLAIQRQQVSALLAIARNIRYNRAREQIETWTRQAMLGKIDVATGQKQALEIEVESLALGHYPLSVLSKLAEAGLLDETTEYWPYDGEYWPDEYK